MAGVLGVLFFAVPLILPNANEELVSEAKRGHHAEVERLVEAGAEENYVKPDGTGAAQAEEESAKFSVALSDAQELFRAKEWVKARERLSVALAIEPASEVALALSQSIDEAVRVECDALLAQAREAIQRENWAETKRLATEATALSPGNGEAAGVQEQADKEWRFSSALYLADGFIEAQQWLAADSQLSEALKLKPGNEQALELRRSAEAQIDAARYAQAIDRSRTGLDEGRFDDAVDAAQAALTVRPSDGDAQELLERAVSAREVDSQFKRSLAAAEEMLAQAKWGEAKQAVNEALALKPADDVALQAMQKIEAAERRAVANYRPLDTEVFGAECDLRGSRFAEDIVARHSGAMVRYVGTLRKVDSADMTVVFDKATDSEYRMFRVQATLADDQKDLMDSLASSKRAWNHNRSWEKAQVLVAGRVERALAGSKVSRILSHIAAPADEDEMITVYLGDARLFDDAGSR